MKFVVALFSLLIPLVALGQAPTPTFEQVVEVLEAEQPNTVAKALVAIKAKYPKFFDQYALIARSMSIQGGDVDSPRVILFDQDAQLVMTFNGHSGQRGF